MNMIQRQFPANRAASRKPIPISKLLNWFLFLVLFVASSVFAQVITTSTSSLTFPTDGSLTNENSIRQAGRIAEIGLAELKADVAALEKKEEALGKEIAVYQQAVKVDIQTRDKMVKDYEVKNTANSAAAAAYNADNAAFMALPAKQQTQGALDALNRRGDIGRKESDSLKGTSRNSNHLEKRGMECE